MQTLSPPVSPLAGTDLPSTLRYVVQSQDIQSAQRRHTLWYVVAPLIATLLGPLLLPQHIHWPLAAVSFAAMGTLVGGLGITVGFHRHFAHRAFKTSRWLRIVMAVAGQMAAQGPVLYWTALHRRHHSFSDRPGDPHSPAPQAQARPGSRWNAFWHAHGGWAFSHPVPMPSRYVADLLADRPIRRINARYRSCVWAGLLLPAIAGAAWTGSLSGALVGLYFGGFLRLSVTTQCIWGVNSICHRYGRRPHDTGDGSTNSALWALLTYGEGWHNNHHHQPASARFGWGWLQPDAGWVIVRTLRALGLVWNVREGQRMTAERAPGTPA